MGRRDQGQTPGQSARPGSPTWEGRVEQLERRNSELLEVISVAAHDLKEPLRNLGALAARLASLVGDSLEPEARAVVESLTAEAERNQRLVDDLLLYARVLGGPLRLEKVSLEEALGWALSSLRSRIEREGAEITSEPLPHVVADRSRMTQLFQNLVANALTYRGRAPARVHVSARASTTGWEVSVQDRGIGVPSRDRERIFEPFARLHPQSRYPGTGLGLAICRGIVEAHGGELRMEAASEGGSLFVFTIPTVQRGRRSPDRQRLDA